MNQENKTDMLSYFNINWLSRTDGPGRRTVLFLQGCHLDCTWCHSPHSLPPKSPLLYFNALCRHCRRCEEVCPQGVHKFMGKHHLVLRENCTQCGKCIEACPQSSEYKPANALVLPTKTQTVDTVFKVLRPQLELLQDDGGITFSGGEPLLQAKALVQLAKKCKASGFNTALETSGIVPLRSVEIMAPYIDTWLFGMRLTTGTHQFSAAYLERQTRRIFQYLAGQAKSRIIVRIPAIEGHTTTPYFLDRAMEIIHTHPGQPIEIMPLNKNSTHYYTAMGITPAIDFDALRAQTAHETISSYLRTEKVLNHEN